MNFSINSSSKQQTTSFSSPHVQRHRPKSLLDITNSIVQPSSSVNSVVYQNHSMNSTVPKQLANLIGSNHILSDRGINIKSEIVNYFYFSFQISIHICFFQSTTLKNTQQVAQLSADKTVDNSSHEPNILTDQTKDVQKHELIIDPSLQWRSIKSKSLRDIPHLSHKYADIPLQITLPDGSPTHNQKLLNKHDISLEKRLLKAGLSPETVALYERLLEVATIRQMTIISPV